MNVHLPSMQTAHAPTSGLSDLAVIGTGTMGGSLALNLVEHGFQVSLFDRAKDSVAKLMSRAGELQLGLRAPSSLQAVVSSLKAPRCLLLMIPAGEAIDEIIAATAPLLNAGDLIIDAGNSNFRDTARRHDDLSKAGIAFMGLGVSGGEKALVTALLSWQADPRPHGTEWRLCWKPLPQTTMARLVQPMWEPQDPAIW